MLRGTHRRGSKVSCELKARWLAGSVGHVRAAPARKLKAGTSKCFRRGRGTHREKTRFTIDESVDGKEKGRLPSKSLSFEEGP